MNETNPVPRASKGANTPKPMRKQKAVFVSRKVRVYKTVPTTAANVNVTAGDVATQLSLAGQATVRVDGAQVWNMTNQGRTTNYVGLGFSSVVGNDSNTDFVGTDLFEDWGGHNSTPTVRVDLPNSLVLDTVVAGPSSTQQLLVLSAVPSNPVFTADFPQTLVVDLYLRVKAE